MIKEKIDYPLLLTREQASNYLGIDPKSFDRYVRSSVQLPRFMVGAHERYTKEALQLFVLNHSIC